MKRLILSFRYLHYFFKSITRFGIHSPFVYDLVEKTIYDKTPCEDCYRLYALRKRLMRDHELVSYTAFGSSPRKEQVVTETVSRIIRKYSKSPKYGTLLYKLVRYFSPGNVLELGTSLGMSAMYMAVAAPEAKVVTVEGSRELAALAGKFFQANHIVNVELRTGEFNEVLPGVLQSMGHADFIFIDGNHLMEQTLGYFETCLPYFSNDTLLVIDDIHHSGEMHKAWVRICRDPRVKVTIDLFFMGLVLVKKELSKQDFVIRL